MKRRYVLIFIIIYSIMPVLLFIFDLINISDYILITANFDWLAFIGAYLSGLGALFLGYIALKQNEGLKDTNDKMLENHMVSSCFSKIDIYKEHYWEDLSDVFHTAYGKKVLNSDYSENKGNKYYHRLIIQIEDKNKLPLTHGKTDSVKVCLNADDNNFFIYNSIDNDYEKLERYNLSDTETFYFPICLLDNQNNLDKLDKCDYLKVIVTLKIKNSFNVVSIGEYTIGLHKSQERDAKNSWTKYRLYAMKAYFKEVKYEKQ